MSPPAAAQNSPCCGARIVVGGKGSTHWYCCSRCHKLIPDAIWMLNSTRRSKFNVDQSETGRMRREFQGIVYDSLAECRYARELEIRKKAGDIVDWKRFRQPDYAPFDLTVNGIKIGTYRPDFAVTEHDDFYYVEVKGRELPDWEMKKRLMQALYPEVKVVVEYVRPRRGR